MKTHQSSTVSLLDYIARRINLDEEASERECVCVCVEGRKGSSKKDIVCPERTRKTRCCPVAVAVVIFRVYD